MIPGHDGLLKGLAGHELGQVRLANALRREDADKLAVSQHGDARGDFEHLRQPMADEDNGDPLQGKSADDVEKPLGFRPGERGSRLVHEDHASVVDQRAGYRHDLPLRNRKRAEPRIDVNVGSEPRQDVTGGSPYGLVIDETRCVAEHGLDADILSDGHLGEEGKILPDDLNAGCARHCRRHGADEVTGNGEMSAGRGLIDAGDDFDQRALAAAVLASDALHLAGQDLEADAVQRPHSTEAHTDFA